MIKRVVWLISFVILVGCVTVNMPQYIRDEHTYKKRYYGTFEKVYNAVFGALEFSGWEVTATHDPVIFDYTKSLVDDPSGQQILLFAQLKKASMIAVPGYSLLNVYIGTTGDNSIDLELRYHKITRLGVKNISSYRNDDLAENIFEKIEELLK